MVKAKNKADILGLSRKVCKFIYESLDLNVAHSWG